MIFGSRRREARGLLIQEYLVMPLVLPWDPLFFHAFLLPLILALNRPFLSEVCFTDLDPLL
jgi:hypothetical protein